MNATKHATWFFIALILSAFLAWYLASEKPIVRLDEKSLSTSTDAVIKQLTVQQFDATGQRVHFLQTALLRHIPYNNTHELSAPHIYVAQNDSNWEIHAKQAVALYGGQQITFKKHVRIHQKKDAHHEASLLKTEEITYYPKEKLAITEKNILFKQAGNFIQSKGMKAYLAENRVKLLGNARGMYESKAG